MIRDLEADRQAALDAVRALDSAMRQLAENGDIKAIDKVLHRQMLGLLWGTEVLRQHAEDRLAEATALLDGETEAPAPDRHLKPVT